VRLKFSGLDILVLLFTLSALPALWVGYDSLLGLPTLIALFGCCLIYFTVSRLGVSERGWRALAGGLVVFGAVIAVYFITQAGRLDYDDKFEVIFRFSGWISTVFPAVPFWKPQTNSIGTFLEGVLFLCVTLSIDAAGRLEKWTWRGVGLVLGLALILCSSRGAWLAVLAAAALWIALRWRPMRWLLVAGAVFGSSLVIWVLARGSLNAVNEIPFLPRLVTLLFNRPDRFAVIWNSLILARDFPYTGIGLGDQFSLVYSRYQMILPYVYLTYSHNLYLQVWLEQGLLGLTLWIGLIISVLFQLKLPAVEPRRIQLEAAWTGLAAILIHGVVDARMYADLWCWLPFFTLLGLLVAVPRVQRLPARTSRLQSWGLAGFLLVFIVLNPPAAFLTNLGALAQMRADLAPGLNAGQREEDLARAVDYFVGARTLTPDQVGANFRLGLIALDRHDFPGAIGYLERARRDGFRHNGLEKALGLAYTFSGRLEEGQPYLQNQVGIVDELNYWGGYFDGIQQGAVSRNAFRQSLRIQPDQPDLRRILD
jgi:O-antigen ligase